MSKHQSSTQRLKDLMQYGIDATFIIAQGTSCVADQAMREMLSHFQEDWEHDIKTLSALLVARGEPAPEHTRDFKGFFMQGYTGMRGLISDQGAMRALATNMNIVVHAFEDALKDEQVEAIRPQLEEILHHAKTHLAYFTSNS